MGVYLIFRMILRLVLSEMVVWSRVGLVFRGIVALARFRMDYGEIELFLSMWWVLLRTISWSCARLLNQNCCCSVRRMWESPGGAWCQWKWGMWDVESLHPRALMLIACNFEEKDCRTMLVTPQAKKERRQTARADLRLPPARCRITLQDYLPLPKQSLEANEHQSMTHINPDRK